MSMISLHPVKPPATCKTLMSTQGRHHEFEGGGGWVNVLESGVVNIVKTLQFVKVEGCMTPPPAPMVAPPTFLYIYVFDVFFV